MPVNKEAYLKLRSTLDQQGVTLVAVSKTKPVADIQELYEMGQRDFGENYVQELVDKQAKLPPDIRWHFIGHLQSNKVKYIAPFVHLIHGVDSYKLLGEIDRQAAKNNRTIACLLQVHIAEEESKFGFDEPGIRQVVANIKAEHQEGRLSHVRVQGLMGMASFTDREEQLHREFNQLKKIYDEQDYFQVLSMGMSGDYAIAVSEGSNMVRIGSLLFGARSSSSSKQVQ